MNSITREEARKSLQALLTASKAHAQLPPENGKHQDEGSLSRIRAEMQLAFRRPPSAAKAAERAALEKQVSRLLDAVPSSNGGAPAPVPASAEEEDEEEEEDSDQENIVQPAPIKQRILTRSEEGSLAEALRRQVADARKRLFTLDRKVTELTRDLKLGRSEIWTHQQSLSTAEARMASVLRERASDLDAAAREEEGRLEKEERELAQDLGEVRANAARWSSVAKRQDTMLQQERESQRGSDAHGILAKHPAGEVFLPRFSRDDDDDSDDERYARARRHYGRPTSGDEGVSLGSDDSDDDLQVPRAPSGGDRGVSKDQPPPAPAPQHRGTAPAPLRMDDGDESEGSSLPTPSSAATSPAASPAGNKRAAGASGINGGASAQRAKLHSDSTSESDEEPAQKKAEAPALPELKGIGNARGRPALREEDDAEEVSSEDGLSTSRSV